MNSKIAKVILLRGKVQSTLGNKTRGLQIGRWVLEGALIKTAAKSFAKLLFVDKTQVNIGPSSQMKMEKYKKDEPEMISLMKGKVRLKVEQGYFKKESQKSTLFIKTHNAALGVRGTDFEVLYVPQNQSTNTVTYSGEVKMVQMDSAIDINYSKLENALSADEAVSIKQGQYSGVNPNLRKHATIATKLDPTQFNALKHNTGMNESSYKKETTAKEYRSIIPPGADTKSFVQGNSGLDASIGDKTVTEVKGIQKHN